MGSFKKQRHVQNDLSVKKERKVLRNNM